MLGFFKIKKLRTIIIIYWILLAYIIAALFYWFLLLNKQNATLTQFRINQVSVSSHDSLRSVAYDKHRKEIQYIAEGLTFLLLIIAGAVFVYRAVRRQLKMSQLQHNFMIALTHELKTPIAVTKLNLETLKKRVLPADVQQKLIGNTLQEANRLNDLCSNMLLASQFEAGGYNFLFELNNISEIVSQTVNEFSIRFPDRLFTPDIQKDIYLSCDKLLFQIALNNLLDNAVKYSTTEIRIALDRNHNKIILSVMDSGVGIPDIEKYKVFQKFYRIGNRHTKEAKGTGLGLYLTKTIVNQNKGKIEILDNNPSGCIFRITFKNDKY
ncbi:MAG: HAMP domain-containing sensor histidine kinase [Ginsengibacter sp.]